MATKLICPDCGGVLGPAEPGEAVCACFKNSNSTLEESSGPGKPTPEETLSDTDPVETVSKFCFKCGADVVGKKRYKDSRGYICADCNRAEIEAEKAGTALCGECGRRVKVGALSDFHGKNVCRLCLAELRDTDKKKIRVISGKGFEAQDRRTLKILIVVMIILAIFMVVGYFKR